MPDPYADELLDVPSGNPSTAAWLATGALVASSLGYFTCYTSYFLALPLAAAGAWQSWKLISSPVRDQLSEQARNVSYASLTGSIVALLLSLGLLMLFAVVIIFYIVIFVFAGAAAAFGN